MMTLAFIYRIAGFRDFDSWRQTQPADLRLFRQLVLLASSWIYNRHHRELMTFPWRFMVLADSRTTAAERAQVKVQETSENAHSPLQACLKRKHTCVLQAQPVIITYHQRVERSAVIVLTVSMSSAFVSQPRSRPRSSTWSWSWIALSNLGLSLSLSLSLYFPCLACFACFPMLRQRSLKTSCPARRATTGLVSHGVFEPESTTGRSCSRRCSPRCGSRSLRCCASPSQALSDATH